MPRAKTSLPRLASLRGGKLSQLPTSTILLLSMRVWRQGISHKTPSFTSTMKALH